MVIECIKSAELALEVLQAEYKHNPSEDLANEIQYLNDRIRNYKNNLSKMPEIENRLYYKIMYEGKNIMKAVNEVADENYFNGVKPANYQWIYDKYYKKIKNLIKP